MYVLLIVVLILAVLLEYLSIRKGTSSASYDFSLSEIRIEPGSEVYTISEIRNLGRLPISYLSVRTSYPIHASIPNDVLVDKDKELIFVTDVFRMWGKQKITRSMPFTIEKRGIHTVCAKEITRGDFLGLTSDSNQLSIYKRLVVFPKRMENDALTEALGNYCGELSAQRWLIRDPILTLGIREYTGYEPMNTISWTHTAQRNEIMVREFDYTRSLNCCVVLCTDSLSYNDIELLDIECSIVRTVCEDLIAKGIDAEFYTNADIIGFERNPFRKYTASTGHVEDILDTLARATPFHLCPLEKLLEFCLSQQSNESAFLLIAPVQDSNTSEAITFLNAKTGNTPLLISADTYLS